MGLDSTPHRLLAAALTAAMVVSPHLSTDAWADEEATEDEVQEAQDLVLDEAEEEDEFEPDYGPAVGLTVLGVASVAGAVSFFIASSDDESLSTSVAPSDPLYAADLMDRSDREQTLAIVLTGVGAALLGTATYFWITAGDEDDEAQVTGLGVAPAVTWNSAGVVLGGRF